MFTAQFTVEVGRLLRRDFRKFLDRQRFRQAGNIDVTYHETKHLLESEFLVRISGPRTFVRAWCDATRDMLQTWEVA